MKETREQIIAGEEKLLKEVRESTEEYHQRLKKLHEEPWPEDMRQFIIHAEYVATMSSVLMMAISTNAVAEARCLHEIEKAKQIRKWFWN